MATETVTPRPLAIPEERLLLGLEAAWELDALRNTVNDLGSELGDPELTQCDLMAMRLKVRGLTMRMGQLASVVMSIFDDELETTELFIKVHGHTPAAEVARG